MPSANTSTVAAIVVTYNRLEKLKNVLASLEAQTRLPEHLVIVNNASTDDTAAYLAEYERDFTLKDKVRITIVTLTENAGGAGGFSAGMRKGYELGADFVWIFDDDGYPPLWRSCSKAMTMRSPDLAPMYRTCAPWSSSSTGPSPK